MRIFIRKPVLAQGVLFEEVSSLVGEQLPPAGLPPIYLRVIAESSFIDESSLCIFASNLAISYAVV